ncbi:hypothetical protein CKN82_12810 [Carnobacterium divergens]|uniref:hypothetical protein n=5 Tax=Carnobacterium divergens TaxID=2748 RepID=UPI00107287D8|nr:hypothetical protein [Carnobacterium divergens]TFI77054.1 hypothetical protein CKN68_13130 [Carnobacterium divergens]TFI85632.1 hypothetical protein CKN72_12650 [Carnobacterium divergens]TFI94691.1 hypothetical protein CKN67_13040 [Carnobacterium divergens]TFI95171.1 hypothetical protein CKN82_12810 [Carnobacterium divergens]TFJ11859.1 hypothetical protein CKN66_13150 [Carnobacterium divergens]
MKQSIYYNEGVKDCDIVFVLSCPGRDEEISTPPKPLSKDTYESLNTLLSILRSSDNEYSSQLRSIFKYDDIYSYTITKASEKIHYEKKTGDAEPSVNEIKENIPRLKKDLDHKRLIVSCGNIAKKALSYCDISEKVFVLQMMHPSFSAINRQIKSDIYGNKLITGEKGNKIKRLKVLSNMLENELLKKGLLKVN